jgi:hypothetical protein
LPFRDLDRSAQAAEGLALLSRTLPYRRLLPFPASCYTPEILELERFSASASEPPPSNAPGYSPEDMVLWQLSRKGDMTEGCRIALEEWGSENLWCIPVEIPNESGPAYGLTWCLLPDNEKPWPQSEWSLRDPQTREDGTLVRVNMASFRVSQDLWERIGLGALLRRRIFRAYPQEAED